MIQIRVHCMLRTLYQMLLFQPPARLSYLGVAPVSGNKFAIANGNKAVADQMMRAARVKGVTVERKGCIQGRSTQGCIATRPRGKRQNRLYCK